MTASDPQQLRLEVERIDPPETRPRSASRKRVSQGGGRAGSDSPRSAAALLLGSPEALLTRSHLRELGLERRAVDAVFRALPVVALPGYSRPMVRARDYLALLEHHTFRGDRIRPMPARTGTAEG